MRKVSIKGKTDPFSRTVQVDHIFLDVNLDLHIMEHPHRYSIGIPVSSTDVQSAMDAIESRWFTEFWPPQFETFDNAFSTAYFKEFLKEYGISPLVIPARRRNKLAIESKHRILRDIFVTLNNANPNSSFLRSLL